VVCCWIHRPKVEAPGGSPASATAPALTPTVVAVKVKPTRIKLLKAIATQCGKALKKQEVSTASLWIVTDCSGAAIPPVPVTGEGIARAIDGVGLTVVPTGGTLHSRPPPSVYSAMADLRLAGRSEALGETQAVRRVVREAAFASEDHRRTPVLLWKDTDKNGYLTNWNIDGFFVQQIRYRCVEQYIMASKAQLMGDCKSLEAIMAARTPREMKRLGRQVHPWRQKIWSRNMAHVLETAIRAKFAQNSELRDRLVRTHPRPIAEASPSDTVYGIGLAPCDLRAQDPANWKGLNLLGKTLERVRAEFLFDASAVKSSENAVAVHASA
jgi:ribA/ribD-fused uncharacterized protein